jgi:two-component system chemotaxis response regulator CheY
MKNVLIVDDAAFVRTMLKQVLERNGFDVVGEAENGNIGVRKYKELQPDIVTMDITMPEMDGLEALKVIRKEYPKAKIVMITALGQEPMIKQAILNGAKSFIVKPFKEEHVIQTMSKISAM